jgi:hypothetical protein
LQTDGLWLLIAHADPYPRALGGDREVLISQPSDQVKGLLDRLLLRSPQRVCLDVLLDGRPDLRRGAEVAVRRHQSIQRLVRPLEVVPFDEERQPSLAIREVREDRAAQEFLPQRLPESLDLSERLRVLRPTLEVPDPILAQPLLKLRLSAPGSVLPPLVRQDLLRSAKGRDPSLQRFQHDRPFLMVRQRESHDETRVVVHEGRQIEPLMASEQKREDVRLPQLIRRRALEAPRGALPAVHGPGHRRGLHPRLRQDASHRTRRHPQRFESLHQIADPPCAVLGILLL